MLRYSEASGPSVGLCRCFGVRQHDTQCFFARDYLECSLQESHDKLTCTNVVSFPRRRHRGLSLLLRAVRAGRRVARGSLETDRAAAYPGGTVGHLRRILGLDMPTDAAGKLAASSGRRRAI